MVDWSSVFDWKRRTAYLRSALIRISPSRWISTSGFFPLSKRSKKILADGLGPQGELLAAQFLKRKGYRILEHGYKSKAGEIDLIAIAKGIIVFVEVKTWQRASEGGPSDAVGLTKQRRITQTALFYLKRHRLLETPARFDVIQIVMRDYNRPESDQPEIRHFENAFEATGEFQLFS